MDDFEIAHKICKFFDRVQFPLKNETKLIKAETQELQKYFKIYIVKMHLSLSPVQNVYT